MPACFSPRMQGFAALCQNRLQRRAGGRRTSEDAEARGRVSEPKESSEKNGEEPQDLNRVDRGDQKPLRSFVGL